MKKISLLWILALFCTVFSTVFSTEAWAQDDDSAAEEAATEAESKAADEGGVLNFEGDVIEGQRKRPDLFLQTEVQSLTLDAILYLRKDFNDFHQVDRNRRPGFYQKRTRGSK